MKIKINLNYEQQEILDYFIDAIMFEKHNPNKKDYEKFRIMPASVLEHLRNITKNDKEYDLMVDKNGFYNYLYFFDYSTTRKLTKVNTYKITVFPTIQEKSSSEVFIYGVGLIDKDELPETINYYGHFTLLFYRNNGVYYCEHI